MDTKKRGMSSRNDSWIIRKICGPAGGLKQLSSDFKSCIIQLTELQRIGTWTDEQCNP